MDIDDNDDYGDDDNDEDDYVDSPQIINGSPQNSSFCSFV